MEQTRPLTATGKEREGRRRLENEGEASVPHSPVTTPPPTRPQLLEVLPTPISPTHRLALLLGEIPDQTHLPLSVASPATPPGPYYCPRRKPANT